MSTKALKFTGLLFLLMLAVVAPLHAASNGTIGIATATPGQTPDNCNDVRLDYHFTLTANTDDDGKGNDWYAVVMTDGNGKAIDTDFFDEPAGGVDTIDSFDGGNPESISARPITFKLYDTGFPDTIEENTIAGHNFAAAGTLMAQTVFDPGTLTTNGTCETLPFGSAPDCLTLPAGSVVGNTPYQVQVYWSPGKVSPGVMLNPGNYWVIGTDDSGKFYKIMLSCQFVWVPVQDFQPSFEAPWSGQPLPTTVVK